MLGSLVHESQQLLDQLEFGEGGLYDIRAHSITRPCDAELAILPTPIVSDPGLQNRINDLYRGTTNPNRIGDGTTADAIRGEGSHITKGQQYVRGLRKWLRSNPAADPHDTLVARSLLQDLIDALRTVGRAAE